MARGSAGGSWDVCLSSSGIRAGQPSPALVLVVEHKSTLLTNAKMEERNRRSLARAEQVGCRGLETL